MYNYNTETLNVLLIEPCPYNTINKLLKLYIFFSVTKNLYLLYIKQPSEDKKN